MGIAPGLARKGCLPSKSSQALALSLGYTTAPAMLPPYCGIPKFPIALSRCPRSEVGDVTIRLFFSTTKRASTAAADASSASGRSSSRRNPTAPIACELRRRRALRSEERLNGIDADEDFLYFFLLPPDISLSLLSHSLSSWFAWLARVV